jgi:predicted DNA binding CopG/RHH family protein
MSKPEKLKSFPRYDTDEDAERFVDEADLSEYDFSGFKPMTFELIKKDARVNMRLPQPLLAKIKSRAAAEGIPYQRFMRDLMERGLAPEPAGTCK